MRKLLGYCCHLASVRLHEAAAWCFEIDTGNGVHCGDDTHIPPDFSLGDHAVPVIDHNGVCVDAEYVPDWGVKLSDVAPRLDDALDVVRDKVQHAQWLAGIVGLGRVAEKEEQDG